MEKNLLDRLLKHFYVSTEDELIWPYIEDTELRDIDEDLAYDLRIYIKKNNNY